MSTRVNLSPAPTLNHNASTRHPTPLHAPSRLVTPRPFILRPVTPLHLAHPPLERFGSSTSPRRVSHFQQLVSFHVKLNTFPSRVINLFDTFRDQIVVLVTCVLGFGLSYLCVRRNALKRFAFYQFFLRYYRFTLNFSLCYKICIEQICVL